MPFQDVDAAAKETQRAIGELGLAGVAVGTFGMKEHLGQPMYWPIYEQLEKFNVPLLVHNSRQGPPAKSVSTPSYFAILLDGRLKVSPDCAALVYGGVPERFPKLRIAFLECGRGWVPYWMDRMDEEWEKRKAEAPLLKKKPSEYITAGNWFFAAEPEESTVPFCLEKIGEDVILFRIGLSPLGRRFSLYDSDRQGAKRY